MLQKYTSHFLQKLLPRNWAADAARSPSPLVEVVAELQCQDPNTNCQHHWPVEASVAHLPKAWQDPNAQSFQRATPPFFLRKKKWKKAANSKCPKRSNLHFLEGRHIISHENRIFSTSFKISNFRKKNTELICGNIWPHIYFPPPSSEEIVTPLPFPHGSTAQRVMMWDVEARVVRLNDSSCYYCKTAVPHHNH